MNIKKLCALVLSVAVVGGASASIYANQKSDASTKNVVVTTDNQQAAKASKDTTANKEQAAKINDKHTGDISDEKAVEIAAKAMKDYMGIDANYYSKTKVDREKHAVNGVVSDKEKQQLEQAQKTLLKVHPELAKNSQASLDKAIEALKHEDDTIIVSFTPADGSQKTNCVIIDEITGNIIDITALNNLDSVAKGKVDEAKVKEAAINFLKKMGEDSAVDLNSMEIKNDDGPLSSIRINVKTPSNKLYGDAPNITVEVSLQDYTVVHYDNYSDTHNK